MPANWVESGNLRLQTSSSAFVWITITIVIIHDCHYYQYDDEKKNPGKSIGGEVDSEESTR